MTSVRFAPAPTGFLHISGARTFIFNCRYARQQGGQVVLRIDGAAVERSAGESLASNRPAAAPARFSVCSEKSACSNACGVSEC
ncbi:MAG: glutamate--tRNA ligase family protein [Bryobacterales bacterium]